MKAILIAWTMPDTDKTTSSALAKMLYGQETSSYGRRYVYWRKGFLDGIPYVKLIRGAFIVKMGDSERVIEFLLNQGVKVFLREVDLTERDVSILAQKEPSHEPANVNME